MSSRRTWSIDVTAVDPPPAAPRPNAARNTRRIGSTVPGPADEDHQDGRRSWPRRWRELLNRR